MSEIFTFVFQMLVIPQKDGRVPIMKGLGNQRKKREMFREYTIKCFDNARQFIQDAELLINHQSYGHAYALLILGFEEWAKAMSGFIIHSGGVDAPDNESRSIWRDHLVKQHFGYIFVFGILVEIIARESSLKADYDKLGLELKSGKIDEKTFEERLRNLFQKDPSPAAKDIVKLQKLFDKLNKKPNLIDVQKQAGIYVEYHLKDFSTSSPHERFTKKGVEARLKTYKSIIVYTSFLIDVLKDRKLRNLYLKEWYEFVEHHRQKRDKKRGS